MPRSESLRRNALSAARSGRQSGPPPLGYVLKACGSAPEIDPALRQAIALAFEFAAGGSSLGSICETLARLGVRSRNGKQLSRQALHAVLRNPYYAGFVRLNGKTFRGTHEPIVTERRLYAATAALSARKG